MDKQEIQKLPNNIGGDTKSFVAKLKKVLLSLSDSLSDVTDRVDNVEPDEVAQLIGLKVTEEHTTDGNGMPQNNIVVEYDNTNVSDFASANIWLSDDNGSNFQRVGSSNNLRFIIENVKAGITYVVKATAVNKKGNESDFDEAPSAVITIKGSVLVPDAPYQFYLTWGPDGPLWEWLYNDNGYIDFFELRLDANAGEYNENLLDRTRNSYSTANPGVRSGTAYLFVRNIFGTYSLPATHIFNKPVGQKPNVATIIKLLYGVNIKMDPLPEGYTGYKLIINDTDEYTTHNNEFTFYQVSGTITVKYCFVDDIGEGEYSDTVTVQIKTVFDDVEIPEVNYEMFDSAIQSAIDKANAQAGINETLTSAIEQTSESITAVVTELNKPLDEVSYSAIALLKEGIDLSVKQDDVINRINLSTEGITIDGERLHITGDTVIDGAVIVRSNIADGAVGSENLADGAVTSDKLGAGSVGSVAIADGAVIADHIASNAITSAHITANAITSDKIQAGAIDADKIAAEAITADKIAANAVTAEAIQANSIIAQHLSAGAVTAEKLAADSVTANKIAANAVTAEKINAGAVTAEKMNVTQLSAITAEIGTLRTKTSGARTEIKDNLILIYDENNVLRVRMGVW